MGRISNTWSLVKQSFQVLRSNKQLMLLPVLSAISCVLVTTALIAGGVWFVGPLLKGSTGNAQAPVSPAIGLAGLFVFYVVNYFIIVFFNTALVGAAAIHLEGGHPTINDGLKLASNRLGVILQWAVLAATVGILLKVIENRVKVVGQLIAGLIGMAWSLATYFVVPILAFENLGPFDALKRSSQLLVKNWGEKLVAGFSFGLIFFLLSLLGVCLPLAGHAVASGVGLIIGLVMMVVYFVLLAVVGAATQGIFTTALYRYANTGKLSPGFTRANFSMAWQRK